jgi:hypothetical protein
MADVVPPSAAFVFVSKMSDKLKFTSPSKIHVKNRQKQSILKKISQLEKGEQMVDICHNVRFAHSSIHTIFDSAD